MIRVIRWTAEVEVEGEKECEAAYVAYRNRQAIDVEGWQCWIVSAQPLRMFGGPVIRVNMTVERIEP